MAFNRRLRFLLPFVLLGSIAGYTYADPPDQIGARGLGLAGATATLSDPSNCFGNPGTLGFLNAPEGVLGYQYRYGLSLLPELSAALAYPVLEGKGGAGLGVYRLGSGVYEQTILQGAGAIRVGKAALGLSAGMHQEAFGSLTPTATYRLFTVGMGVATQLSSRVRLAGFVQNVNRPTYTGTGNEQKTRLPVRAGIGLAYVPAPTVRLLVQADKNGLRPMQVRAGCEWQASGIVSVRAGVASAPVGLNAGIRVGLGAFDVEYGVGLHQYVGAQHGLGLRFALPDLAKKKRLEGEDAHE
jgi:hypothetical protein